MSRPLSPERVFPGQVDTRAAAFHLELLTLQGVFAQSNVFPEEELVQGNDSAEVLAFGTLLREVAHRQKEQSWPLLPLERRLVEFVRISSSSTSRKAAWIQSSIGVFHETEDYPVPFFSHEPWKDEDEYKQWEELGEKPSETIARIKAYVQLPTKSMYRRLSGVLKVMNRGGMSKEQGELLRPFFLSVGNDILLQKDGTVHFKVNPEWKKEEIAQFLNQEFGTGAKLTYASSLAVYEMLRDRGIVDTENVTLNIASLTQDFIHAYIFGLEDPSHPVSAVQAAQCIDIYEAYQANGNDDGMFGWTPHHGMKLESLQQTNAALQIAHPLLKTHIQSVNGMHADTPKFENEYHHALGVVRGSSSLVQSLTRQLFIKIFEEYKSKGKTSPRRHGRLFDISSEVHAKMPGLLGGRWYEGERDFQTPTPDDSYWHTLLNPRALLGES